MRLLTPANTHRLVGHGHSHEAPTLTVHDQDYVELIDGDSDNAMDEFIAALMTDWVDSGATHKQTASVSNSHATKNRNSRRSNVSLLSDASNQHSAEEGGEQRGLTSRRSWMISYSDH